MRELPYHFRYWVDGEWRTDFHADGFVLADDKTPASVIDLSDAGNRPGLIKQKVLHA